MPKPVMIMGCTRDAGKSFLITALCQHFANREAHMAPLKAHQGIQKMRMVRVRMETPSGLGQTTVFSLCRTDFRSYASGYFFQHIDLLDDFNKVQQKLIKILGDAKMPSIDHNWDVVF